MLRAPAVALHLELHARALARTFEQRIEHFERAFEGREVPRPPRWGGFRVVPRNVEFWYGAQYRLHERWLYECDDSGEWSKRMLYP